MRILIIGGGIGGLTTAIALQQQNIDCQIFEAAPTFVAISRSILHALLISKLEPSTLTIGKKCIRIEQEDKEVRAFFADGTHAIGDCLIAADGIHSTIRQQLFPQAQVRSVGQFCIRGIATISLDPPWDKKGIEVWHKRIRFGFSQVAPQQVYWYFTQPMTELVAPEWFQELASKMPEKALPDLLDPIPQIVAATTKSKMFYTNLYDLPKISTWVEGRVALLGDAAHAMTPNLGQGASQAVEDAIALAVCLHDKGELPTKLQFYQNSRKPRADKFVQMSYRVGQLASLQYPLFIKLRNFLLQSLPKFIQNR